jgi:DNA-binding beta-propeller fold protein YncE
MKIQLSSIYTSHMQRLLALLLTVVTLTFHSCMDDDSFWERNSKKYPRQSKGLFIVNEGNFWYNNASLSFYNPEERILYNDVFYNTNRLPLGDVAQSMIIRDTLGYVVINNSGKIYIINTGNFELVDKITGLSSPRHMYFVNDEKAYVTDLYSKSITIVNPLSRTIVGFINLDAHTNQFSQHSTDQMIMFENRIFTNSWMYNNKILVIDTQTDQWIETIEVHLQPQSMVLDKNAKLWVLCDGGFQGNPYGYEAPALMRIDATTFKTEKVYRFEKDDHPRELAINAAADTIYFINKHLYRHPVHSNADPEVYILNPNNNVTWGGFYSLGIDPYSGDIYIGDAIDHVQPGRVFRFKADATPLDTLKVGIIPGKFSFKQNTPDKID